MFRPRMRGRGRSPGLGIGLLVMQVMRVGVNNVPPVTLFTMGAQVAIFLRLFQLPFKSSISDVCVSAFSVWYREEWHRLLYAPFFHLDEWHLYFNMVSYMWKGRSLEQKMGSGYFLYMIAVFTALTSLTNVGLAIAAEKLLDDPSYVTSCAAGFSGVIFALKVVTTHMMPPGMTYVMGLIPVHSRLSCWAELLLIHLLVPRSSFIGRFIVIAVWIVNLSECHLSGILIGLLYVKGPLKSVMNAFISPEPTYRYHVGPTGRTTGGRAASGSRSDRQQADHDRYTGGLSEEEQVAEALRRSQTENQYRERPAPSAPPDPSGSASHTSAPTRLYPDLNAPSSAHSNSNTLSAEDVRRRRLQRFDNS